MRYLEVNIRCERAAADAVANLLSELTGGGYAVDDPLDIIQNQERGTWDATDLVPGDPAWVTVRGWLSEAGDAEAARLTLEHGLAEVGALGLGTIDPPVYAWVQDEDWANAWKAFFKPMHVGERLVVIPSWEDYELNAGELPLYLDPGMAFGTGSHATTGLCLRWLERVVKPGASVIDVGTGSGILAIAAARLGAGAITAIDIDPVAVQVAHENVAKNGVAVNVRAGTLDQVDVMAVELITANIIASVIIDLLPEIVPRLKRGGRFLASGIIAEKKQTVADAMVNAWLLPVETREEGGWVAILATKP
ncbi:MAG TPA: 50S ribosomal protein L11 methyltransferase [Symbiobacteriaceae bacterium]